MSRAPTPLDLYLLNQVRQVLARDEPEEIKDVLSSLETGIAFILATRSADETEIALAIIASIVDDIRDGKFPPLPGEPPRRDQ